MQVAPPTLGRDLTSCSSIASVELLETLLTILSSKFLHVESAYPGHHLEAAESPLYGLFRSLVILSQRVYISPFIMAAKSSAFFSGRDMAEFLPLYTLMRAGGIY